MEIDFDLYAITLTYSKDIDEEDMDKINKFIQKIENVPSLLDYSESNDDNNEHINIMFNKVIYDDIMSSIKQTKLFSYSYPVKMKPVNFSK